MNHPFSKIWIIVIIVVFIAGGVLAWQYFELLKEEKKLLKELDVISFLFDLREEISYSVDFPELLVSYPDRRVKAKETYRTSFAWLDEKKEINLVKGYELNISLEPAKNINIRGIREEIEAYFSSRGFTKNKTNIGESCGLIGCCSLIGFEKGEIKCIYYHPTPNHFNDEWYFSVGCGIIDKSLNPDYDEIFTLLSPKKDVCDDISIHIEGNFAAGGFSHLTGGGGGGFIAKKENGKWKIVTMFQDTPSCKKLLDNDIPPTFYNKYVQKSGGCIAYAGEDYKDYELLEDYKQEWGEYNYLKLYQANKK